MHWGHVQGECMAGGTCVGDGGMCVVGGMHGRGAMHGRRVCVAGGHVWQGGLAVGHVCHACPPLADTTAMAYGQ